MIIRYRKTSNKRWGSEAQVLINAGSQVNVGVLKQRRVVRVPAIR